MGEYADGLQCLNEGTSTSGRKWRGSTWGVDGGVVGYTTENIARIMFDMSCTMNGNKDANVGLLVVMVRW